MTPSIRRIALLAASSALIASGRARTEPPAEPPLLKYATTWIGNTYGGARFPGLRTRRHVQLSVRAMFVSSDGTCYTDSDWDEDGSEVGIYRDGDVVGSAGHTHGWGYGGGGAVTASKEYLFFAQKVDSENGALKGVGTWPEAGRVWFGVARRRRDGSPAPFATGRGGDGDTLKGGFLLVNEATGSANAEVTGLATDLQNHLFVSTASTGRVNVYDSETMLPLHVWRVERAGALAVNARGELWVAQKAGAGRVAKMLHLTTDGAPMPDSFELPAGVVPGGVCLDAQGRLLITDRGSAQQVRVYDTHNVPPLMTGTIGARGGIFAGKGAEIGRDGPLRFNDPEGVGVDRTGYLYVCSSGSVAGGGTVLESYDEDNRRLWRLEGLAFIDTADPDPASDGLQLYTKDKHFSLESGKSDSTVSGSAVPAAAHSVYKGYTVNRFKFPDDPRLRSGDCGVFFRRIRGRPFLFVTDMYSGGLRLFRFKPETDGECAIPSGYFARSHVKPDAAAGGAPWPAGQPERGEWIWRDANGDGALQPGEFDSAPTDAPALWGWSVDSKGDIWQATEHDGIRRFPLQGIDRVGNPVYTYAAMQKLPAPAPFTELCRAEYAAETDTMFLSGYTALHPHSGGEWGAVGTEIVRYDRWSQGGSAGVRVVLPYDGLKNARKFIKSFAVAGDYLFAGESREPCAIYVYDARNGACVGKLQPDKSVGFNSGWLDFPYAVRAYRRANGEYLVFVEEDLDAKIIVYHWRPS